MRSILQRFLLVLCLAALPAEVRAQTRDPAGDSVRFAQLLGLADMPRGTRQVAEVSPDSTTFVRVFQLGTLSVTVALRVLESPDSLRDYVAAMSLTPAKADSAFRLATRQRGVAVDSQATAAIAVEVTAGTTRTGTFIRAWSPQGPLAHGMIVVPGPQAALVVIVSGYSHAEDAESLFRLVVAASVARLCESTRARQPNDACS